MAKQFQYIVKRPFNYGGQHMQVGEVWEPDGGKFDKQIIDTAHYIRIEEVAPPPKPKTRRRRSKANG